MLCSKIWGKPFLQRSARPLIWRVTKQRLEGYFKIARKNWEWALRGMDPLAHRCATKDKRGSAACSTLVLNADKFKRGE